MSTLQKNTLLKTASSKRCVPKFLREYFFLQPSKNFFPPFFFSIELFSSRTGIVRNRTDIAMNVNRFEQSVCKLDTTHLRTNRTAAANKGFGNSGGRQNSYFNFGNFVKLRFQLDRTRPDSSNLNSTFIPLFNGRRPSVTQLDAPPSPSLVRYMPVEKAVPLNCGVFAKVV